MKLATVAFQSRQKSRAHHSLSSKRPSHFPKEHTCNLNLSLVKTDSGKICESSLKLYPQSKSPKAPTVPFQFTSTLSKATDSTMVLKIRSAPRFFGYHRASTHKQMLPFSPLSKGNPNPLP